MYNIYFCLKLNEKCSNHALPHLPSWLSLLPISTGGRNHFFLNFESSLTPGLRSKSLRIPAFNMAFLKTAYRITRWSSTAFCNIAKSGGFLCYFRTNKVRTVKIFASLVKGILSTAITQEVAQSITTYQLNNYTCTGYIWKWQKARFYLSIKIFLLKKLVLKPENFILLI